MPDSVVQCYVHTDGDRDKSLPVNAIFFNESLQACTNNGTCEKWFGLCETVVTHRPVVWDVYADARLNTKGPAPSVTHTGTQGAIVPQAPNDPRKWFGYPRVDGVASVACKLFGDGDRVTASDLRDFYLDQPGSVCSNVGVCAKWFGMCTIQQ